jgi:hypothetical protein
VSSRASGASAGVGVLVEVELAALVDAAAAPVPVDAQVAGDREDPGRDAGPRRIEGRGLAPQGDHRLLGQLLGGRRRRAAANEVGGDTRREVLEQDREGLPVARGDGPDQIAHLLAVRHRSPASLRRDDGQPRSAGRCRRPQIDPAREVHPASTSARADWITRSPRRP